MRPEADFSIDERLVFEAHPSGLTRGVVNTPRCRASFFLLGGHVAEFQPSGELPVLFMSDASNYEVGKAIRGGVPICFPWFGPKVVDHATGQTDETAPAHGFARTSLWNLESTSLDGEAVVVVLALQLPPYSLRYTLRFDTTLDLNMQVTNQSDSTAECELALHTYFSVADAAAVDVSGLEGVPFLDKVAGKTCDGEPDAIRFTKETDRVYQGAVANLRINDAGNHRQFAITPRSSNSTIVWNPWIDKSKRMPDFGDEEYHTMCCVETANVQENRVKLEPRQTSSMGASISVSSESQ